MLLGLREQGCSVSAPHGKKPSLPLCSLLANGKGAGCSLLQHLVRHKAGTEERSIRAWSCLS